MLKQLSSVCSKWKKKIYEHLLKKIYTGIVVAKSQFQFLYLGMSIPFRFHTFTFKANLILVAIRECQMGGISNSRIGICPSIL